MFNLAPSLELINNSESDSSSIEYDDSDDEYRPLCTQFNSENSSDDESNDDEVISSNGNKM